MNTEITYHMEVPEVMEAARHMRLAALDFDDNSGDSDPRFWQNFCDKRNEFLVINAKYDTPEAADDSDNS